MLLSISASRQSKDYIHARFYSAEILIIVTVKRCDSKNKKTPVLYSCTQLIIFSKGHVKSRGILQFSHKGAISAI